MKSRLFRAGMVLALLWLGGATQAAAPAGEAPPVATQPAEEQQKTKLEAEPAPELNCNPPHETRVMSREDCATYLRPDVDPAVTAKHVCANCHDNGGNSAALQFPRLAKQQKTYLVNQLVGFQKHTRSSQDARDYMWGLATALTPQQIDGLADYFSRQAPKSDPISDADRARAELGRQIFENGIPEKKVLPCGFCHGAQALGLRAFPRLASQHSAYIAKALWEYKENITRPGTPMRQITREMSADEMLAVALYLQSLP